jgi:hypothetical protein
MKPCWEFIVVTKLNTIVFHSLSTNRFIMDRGSDSPSLGGYWRGGVARNQRDALPPGMGGCRRDGC